MKYLIRNKTFESPPVKDICVVYTIKIGEKIYIGSSSNFPARVYYHSNIINKIAEGKHLLPYLSSSYKNFIKEEIIEHGYVFDIHCYCANIKLANIIEQRLIKKHDALCLNVERIVIRQRTAKKKHDRYYPNTIRTSKDARQWISSL